MEIQKKENQEAIKESITNIENDLTPIPNNKYNKNFDIIENIYNSNKFATLLKEITGNETKIEQVANAFTTHGKEVLEAIKKGFTNSDKTKEYIYKQANDAFKIDITNIKKKIETKKQKTKNQSSDDIYISSPSPQQSANTNTTTPLDDLLQIVHNIDQLLQNNTTPEEQEEKNKNITINILTMPRTETTAKQFFETRPESDFQAVMNYFISQGLDDKDLLKEKGKITDPNLKAQVDNFIALLTTYEPNCKIIKIGKAKNDFGSQFPEGTLLIQVENNNNKGKYLTRGSNEHVQDLIAQKANFKKIDRTNPNEIYTFTDDNGNFRGFKKFLEKQDANYFISNIPQIIKQIMTYQYNNNNNNNNKPRSESLTESEMRNGYATALTEFIVEHPEHISNYNKYITEENLILLGVDKATRIKNYNKLVTIWQKNRAQMSQEEQQRLIKLGATIGAQEKITPQEAIKKGFDALVEQFGPMLVQVLQRFGIGKGTLLSIFHHYKEKINELYKKEYQLSETHIQAITKIQGNFSNNPIKTSDNKPKRLVTSKDISDVFTQKNRNIYTDLIRQDNYAKLINVNVFKSGVEEYNKKHNTTLKAEDIITTSIDKTTKKPIITNIINPSTFNNIITTLVDSAKTRNRIASANEQMKTEVKKDKIPQGYNEQGLTRSEIDSYIIHSQADIARYLTVALFTDKDIAYTLAENGLNNGTEIANPDINKSKEGQNTQKQLTFKDGMYNTSTGVTEMGATKRIDEIIEDINNAPDYLLIVDNNNNKIPVKKKNDYTEGNQIITTYIQANGKRVVINKNHKIKAPETIEDKRTILDTRLNAQTIKDDKSTFEGNNYKLNDNNTYQKELANISELFTNQTNYQELIRGNNQTTLKSIVTPQNIIHLKNMFTYWKLKSQNTQQDDTFKDVQSFEYNKLQNIHPNNNQTYEVTASEQDGIQITATEQNTEKFTITIKNTNGTMSLGRKDKTSNSTS